jgi:hypothetical protein
MLVFRWRDYLFRQLHARETAKSLNFGNEAANKLNFGKDVRRLARNTERIARHGNGRQSRSMLGFRRGDRRLILRRCGERCRSDRGASRLRCAAGPDRRQWRPHDHRRNGKPLRPLSHGAGSRLLTYGVRGHPANERLFAKPQGMARLPFPSTTRPRDRQKP